MATMVCHRGLQPCVDSQFIKFNSQLPPPLQFIDFNSCFLDLDLDSPKSLTQCDDINHVLPNHNAANSVPPHSDDAAIAESKSPIAITELESGRSYVHPLVKRSRSTLDEKSLAICTENLGSETGAADFIEDSVFSDLKTERSPMRKRVKSDNRGIKKLFPPPLTTIAGPDSICVRSYREDGRLIMAAVETPARFSYFHVERSHGRLRLSILKSCTPEIDSVEESTENEIKIRNDDVEVVGEKGNYVEDVGGNVEENGNCLGAEIEIEKSERPCRCNEAGENSNIVEIKNSTEMLLFTRETLSIWVSTT